MCNKRNYFYKYYDIEAGILTLQNASRKWANPKIFNDVFDNQFDILFEATPEEFENNLKKWAMEFILENKPIPDNISKDIRQMIKILQSIPKEEFQEIIPLITTSKSIYPHNWIKEKQKKFSDDFKAGMSDTSIFCLAENNDNLLMWAHYAENHTGVVVKFCDVPEADSPIRLAQKVIYANKIPKIPSSNVIIDNQALEEIIKMFTLTKGKQWEYEAEWRIITTLRDKTKLFEIIPFAEKEVADVYLGCKISPENKYLIIEIIKTKYPWAEIYQAKKSMDEYKLEFVKHTTV